MLQSNLLSLALASLLAFTCGYFLGVKKGKSARIVDVAELRVEESVEPSDPVDAPEETPVEVAEIDEPPAEQPAEAPNPFEQRLANAPIVLTDTKDRTIEVAILEVSSSAMKVRRQADNMVVDIPITMLSAEDQDFANYLQESGQFAQKTATNSSQENSRKVEVDDSVGPETRKILEEFFGGFE